MSRSNLYQLNNCFRDYEIAINATLRNNGLIAARPNEYTGYSTLDQFLENVDAYGIQIGNNFEVTFTGVDGIRFYISSFELPGSKQNTCEVFYDGIKITLPVVYDHDHEFSMTVINDANGLLYTSFKTYIELDSYNHYTNPGQSITIRSMTGQVSIDGVIPYAGAVIKCDGVRFTSIGGLQFGQSNNDIQTFTLQGTMISYSHLPAELALHGKSRSTNSSDDVSQSDVNNSQVDAKTQAKAEAEEQKAQAEEEAEEAQEDFESRF